jgi:hypothetical protein
MHYEGDGEGRRKPQSCDQSSNFWNAWNKGGKKY